MDSNNTKAVSVLQSSRELRKRRYDMIKREYENVENYIPTFDALYRNQSEMEQGHPCNLGNYCIKKRKK